MDLNLVKNNAADDSIEQRADYIPTDRLFVETSETSDLFKVVQRALLSSALKTIVGPRGCGKTHMMRHAWLTCQNDTTKPFAVYVSFNKYYRLEPLLIASVMSIIYFRVKALKLYSCVLSFKSPVNF